MGESPTPLDGAIVAFLLRVVDRFEATVSDPDALLANLKAVGLDDSAVTQYQSFLDARASDIAKLSADLPKLLAVIESSSPDLLSLVGPVKDSVDHRDGPGGRRAHGRRARDAAGAVTA